MPHMRDYYCKYYRPVPLQPTTTYIPLPNIKPHSLTIRSLPLIASPPVYKYCPPSNPRTGDDVFIYNLINRTPVELDYIARVLHLCMGLERDMMIKQIIDASTYQEDVRRIARYMGIPNRSHRNGARRYRLKGVLIDDIVDDLMQN